MNQPNALALCGLKDTPQAITSTLQQLAEHGPVVAPGGTVNCVAIAEGYTASITAIYLDQGDVFKDRSSGATCLHAKALNKLAKGLGLEWLPEKTRRLDNFQHPFVCSMAVAGRYRDYSGEWVVVSATHMLDLRDEAAHGRSDKDLRRARKYIQQLCETMAKSRAIADACVDRAIHPTVIQQGRPIVMAKVCRKDAVDAEGATASLYGQPQDGDEPRHVDAEVNDTEPSPAAQPNTAAGLCVPNKPDVYGGDAGKPIGQASDDTLTLFQDNIGSWLEGNPSAASDPKVKSMLDMLDAEIQHRMARAGAGESDGAPW